MFHFLAGKLEKLELDAGSSVYESDESDLEQEFQSRLNKNLEDLRSKLEREADKLMSEDETVSQACSNANIDMTLVFLLSLSLSCNRMIHIQTLLMEMVRLVQLLQRRQCLII
jgi:hypothetical protein